MIKIIIVLLNFAFKWHEIWQADKPILPKIAQAKVSFFLKIQKRPVV